MENKIKKIYLVKVSSNLHEAPVNTKYFILEGNQIYATNKQEILNSSQNIIGYIFFFFSWKLKTDSCAIFPHDESLYLFHNNTFIEIEKNSVQIKKFLFWRIITIKKGSNLPIFIKLFTPPYRWLSNDGMFPETVEPLIDFLIDVNDNYDWKLSKIKKLYQYISKT